MDLSFYPLTLEALDQANAQGNAEALCLFIGADERPLVGLSGLCDWRLSGGLSRMLRGGLVKGEDGEALLTPGSRLGFRKLFLFGMGPQGQSELAGRVAERIRRLGRAGVEDAAFQIPGGISLDLGIRTLIDEPNGPLRARVFGLDPAAMVRALSHAASRGSSEARHERRVIKVASPPKPHPPVRTAAPQRAAPTEIPKASPLSFATAAGKAMPEPTKRAIPPPDKDVPVAPLAEPTPLPPSRVEAAPSTATTAPATGAATAAPPAAVTTSAPATAPAASARPAPENTAPANAAAPSAAPTSQKDLFAPESPRLVGGKAPLPVDYKAPRFVPPEPKPDKKGKGKGKKKR